MTLSLTFGSGDAIAHIESLLRTNLQTYINSAYTSRSIDPPTLQPDSIRRGDDENTPLTQIPSIHVVGVELSTEGVVSRYVSKGSLGVEVCAYVGIPSVRTNLNDPTNNSTQDNHAWALSDALRACIQAHAPDKASGVVAALNTRQRVESVERSNGVRPIAYRKVTLTTTLETRIRAGHNRKL